MYVRARQKQELAIKENDRVASVPLDVYGLENLTSVTKINLRAHDVCLSSSMIVTMTGVVL